jgi:anti-anti-sigma regulatory factor
MSFSDRQVIVKEMPQRYDKASLHKFVQDLSRQMADVVRPAVVLDCSGAGKVDRQTLQLFLKCLEEAMKRNGDVRLAGLHRDAYSVLTFAGIERLFQSFSTINEAIDSYRRPQFDRRIFAPDSESGDTATNAA